MACYCYCSHDSLICTCATCDDTTLKSALHAVSVDLSLQTRSEYSLCRLYTKSGSPRQFDRRPSSTAAVVAAGGGGSENPARPPSAAALPDGEQTRQRRKRAAPPSHDDTSSSSYDDGSTQQQQLADRGTDNDGIVEDMADWSEFLDGWII